MTANATVFGTGVVPGSSPIGKQPHFGDTSGLPVASGFKGVGYRCTKNSDMEGAEPAAPGGSAKPSLSMMVRSMLSC